MSQEMLVRWKEKRMKKAWVLVVVLLSCAAALAAVPQRIGFQGKLTDADTGSVVADGNYSITFRIYTGPTGGAPAWEETQTVSVKDGKYQVLPSALLPASHSTSFCIWGSRLRQILKWYRDTHWPRALPL